MAEMAPFGPEKPQGLHHALGTVAGSIATADFYRRLMQAIGAMLKADLSMVMRYSRHGAPEYVVRDGLSPRDMELYLHGLYRVDPVYRLCREASARGVYSLEDVCTPEERAGEYFSIFLQLTGMADDLVILFPAPAGTTIGLVYERTEAFTREEVEDLRRIYPLLEGMHAAHERLMLSQLAGQTKEPDRPFRIIDHEGRPVFESGAWAAFVAANPEMAARFDGCEVRGGSMVVGPGTVVHAEPLDADFALAPNGSLLILEHGNGGLPPVNYGQALDRFLEGKLTPREREIVRLILLGFPTMKIAERLGLSVNTVKNHKKRMYFKLDITTERELFMTFVSFLFHGG